MMIQMVLLLLIFKQVVSVVKYRHAFNNYKDDQKNLIPKFLARDDSLNDDRRLSLKGSNNPSQEYYHNKPIVIQVGESLSPSNLSQNLQQNLQKNIQQLFDTATSNKPRIRRRRIRRWSRFDAISDRHRDSVNQPVAKAIGDGRRNTEIKIETPDRGSELSDSVWTNRLLPEIVQGIVKEYGAGKLNGANAVESSLNLSSNSIYGDEEAETDTTEIIIPTRPFKHHRRPNVRSAIDCDEWDEYLRTCYFDRNIGDTITFVLAFQNLGPDDIIGIQWQQEFYIRNTNSTLAMVISPDDTMWNIVVGSNNREFRLSPVTETDFDLNFFKATAVVRYPVNEPHEPVTSIIIFRIRQMAIDMGFVYPGEHLVLNVKSFMTLPIECCTFEWYLDKKKNDRTLPSNMKVSDTGITVEISELRMEQEGILACNVYSNRNIFLTKKRFLIKEFKKNAYMQINVNRRSERAPLFHYPASLQRTKRQIDETGNMNENVGRLDPNVEDMTLIPEADGSAVPNPNNFQVPNDQKDMNPVPPNPVQPNLVPPSNQETVPVPPDAILQAEASKIGNLTDTEDEYVIETGKLGTSDRIEIRIAKMLADCVSNRQCSGDASCYQESPRSRRYCRCLAGYRGNGLFCWEEAVGRRFIPPIHFVKNTNYANAIEQ